VEELVYFTGPTMGTRYSVTVPPVDDIIEVQKAVDSRLQAINRLMSTYDPESELSKFNKYRGKDWFPVSRDTAKVVQFALEVARKTNGAFDPTIGPVVNLWGFGPEGRRLDPPGAAEIAKAKKRVGYQHVAARLDPPALRKTRPDIYLDLSAVAKGFAVDDISELLKTFGCDNSLVVIGGDIRANGKKPDGSHWKIGIEEPGGISHPVERKVQVENAALSTSGDWRNAFTYAGTRYSHIIDPRTAKPVQHSLTSVTVLADKTIQTDAYDTALLVMGDELGMDWCERNKVAAMFFIRRSDGSILARASTHLAKRVIP
jgi:thiamine biosynthesis lipoprotein